VFSVPFSSHNVSRLLVTQYILLSLQCSKNLDLILTENGAWYESGRASASRPCIDLPLLFTTNSWIACQRSTRCDAAQGVVRLPVLNIWPSFFAGFISRLLQNFQVWISHISSQAANLDVLELWNERCAQGT
jgi:hypothetical protein